jgi:DNA-binding MarR family transcriptional regulator
MSRTGQARAKPAAKSDDRERLRLWLKLLRTTRGVEAELRTRLRARFGVTLPHFDVMAALARAPEGLTMTELSRALVVSNGNATSLVDALVTRGVVERRPDAQDRRTIRVRLTTIGVRAFAEMAAAHRTWIEDLLGALNSDDVRRIASLLEPLNPSTIKSGNTAAGGP